MKYNHIFNNNNKLIRFERYNYIIIIYFIYLQRLIADQKTIRCKLVALIKTISILGFA